MRMLSEFESSRNYRISIFVQTAMNLNSFFFILSSYLRIREALEKLNELIDESDPDIDLPNIVHAFQSEKN